jgi:hypothetical protein
MGGRSFEVHGNTFKDRVVLVDVDVVFVHIYVRPPESCSNLFDLSI